MKSRFSAVSMIALLALSASAQAANTRGTFSSSGTVPFLNAGTSSDGATNSTALGFQVNGTEYMRLTATGSLGIGTMAPTSAFSVGNLFTVSSTGAVSAGTWNGSMIGTGYLGTGSATTSTFLRGDGSWAAPAGAGWVNLSTTVLSSASVTAGTWYTLDLSSHVGANQTLVLLQVTPAIATSIALKPTGDSLVIGYDGVPTGYGAGPSACYAGAGATCYLLVQTNAAGKIDYQSYYTTTITATLRGFAAPSSSYAPNLWSLNGSNIYYNSGNVGIGTATPSVALDLGSKTDAVLLPVGTSAQRPTASVGMMRYNSTTGAFEGYKAGAWSGLGGSSSLGLTATAAAPARSDDATTGLFSGTASTVSITTNGIERVRVSNSSVNLTGSTLAYAINGYWVVALPAGDTTSLALGPTALAMQTSTSSQNIAIGHSALYNITTGSDNIAMGNNALNYTSTSYGNIAIGNGALFNNTTGTYNFAMGSDALTTNSSGYGNIAIGVQTLYNNTTGFTNLAIGKEALYTNTEGFYNLAVGNSALTQNLTGTENVALGPYALSANTTGNQNTAIGTSALTKNTTGIQNTVLGYYAYSNAASTTGSNNTVIGNNVASTTLTSGSNNILIGTSTTVDTPTASTSNWLNIGNTIYGDLSAGNIGIGTATARTTLDLGGRTDSMIMPTGTTGQRPATGIVGMIRYNSTLSAFEGYQGSTAAWSALGGSSALGTSATAAAPARSDDATTGLFSGTASTVSVTTNGTERLRVSATGANLTGGTFGYGINGNKVVALPGGDTTSLAVGVGALSAQTATNQNNTALGSYALSVTTTGGLGQNTGIGVYALTSNTTGSDNIGLGNYALYSNTTASNNIAIGFQALYATTTGMQNVGIGNSVLRYNTTGSNNVGLGLQALYKNTTGSNNTAIGNNAFYRSSTATTGSNNTILGYSVGSTTLVSGSNNILIGTSSAVDTPAAATSNFLNIGNLIYGDTSTGYVGIGTRTPTSQFEVSSGASTLITVNTTTTTGVSALRFTTSDTAASRWEMGLSGSDNGDQGNFYFYNGTGGRVWTATPAGNLGIKTTTPSYTLHVNGSVAGTSAYNNLSDARMKKDVEPLIYGLETVMQMRPVGFNWINQDQDWKKQHQIGLIAQEVERLIPEVVTTANDEIKTKSIAYGSLVPVLIKAVQDLQEENKALKAQIKEQDAVYNARFKAIENKLNK